MTMMQASSISDKQRNEVASAAQRVLVTGAARGIELAIARAFLSEGAHKLSDLASAGSRHLVQDDPTHESARGSPHIIRCNIFQTG